MRSRLRGLGPRLGRIVGDAGLMIGMAAGVRHGGRGAGAGPTHLDARAAVFKEGHRDFDSRSGTPGLLDRVPGWLLLAVAAIVAVAAAWWGFR